MLCFEGLAVRETKNKGVQKFRTPASKLLVYLDLPVG